jgi:chromosome segregation ATPase
LKASSLDEIARLQKQISQLQEAAVAELRQKRRELEAEIQTIDSQLAELTGKPSTTDKSRAQGRNGVPKPVGKNPDLQELKAILASLPQQTLNLRKEGYDSRNIKVLARANPGLLRLGGNGPWPTVTLLK